MPLLDGITPTGTHVVWEFMHLFKVSGGAVICTATGLQPVRPQVRERWMTIGVTTDGA